MTPLHELLARIRWDPAFGRGRFRLGYLDRLAGGLVYVELKEIAVDPDAHFGFMVTDEEGLTHMVPYHRVKEVWRDGTLIWRRER